ncbi:ABC transporter substrate-binding protein [Sphingomonas sp. MMS24-J13]|uniref:ABC transporter substrate-binding protein n=1 Tax=Sphingomonas sp. MMS24-J13 TaxID=3238686 RepID=UPI00384C0DDC
MPSEHAYPSVPRRWWGLAALLIVVVVVALLVWRTERPATKAASRPVLIVGDQRGGVQALLRAAGELDHVPYKLDFALFPAAAPLLEALGANAIDVGGIGGAPFAFAYASGQPIKAVFAYRVDPARAGRASAIIVRKNSPLHTLADLKGHRLATVRGSAGQDLALKLLEKAGLGPHDVQWVYLDNGQAKAALGSGAIDAWSTWGSYVGIAAIEDGDRILADGSRLPGNVGFYAASNAAIAAKRPLLNDFVQRLSRARIWARAHPRDYAAVLAKETGIPFEVALFSIESNLGTPVEIDDQVVAEQREIFERYRKAGIIATVPDLAGGYDRSFNEAAKGAGH